MFNLAGPGVFVMVVKDFSGVEMKLTRQQRAHNQGMHPERESKFSPTSHRDGFALSCFGPSRLLSPACSL